MGLIVKKYKVTLTKEEREELKEIVRKGRHRSQKVLNALILLNCSEYQERRSKNEEIARILQISMRKIDRVKKTLIHIKLAHYMRHLSPKRQKCWGINSNLYIHPNMEVG